MFSISKNCLLSNSEYLEFENFFPKKIFFWQIFGFEKKTKVIQKKFKDWFLTDLVNGQQISWPCEKPN